MQELNSSNSINSNFQHLIQYDNETANIVNIPFYFKTESQMCLKQYYEDNIRYYLYHTKLDLKFHSAYHYVYLFTFGIILTCVNEKGLTIIKYTSLFSHRLTFDEKDRGLIHLVHYDNELTKKTETKFKCEEEDHSYYVYHFIKKHYVLSWQQLFEDTILSSSTQMYQYHFHVRKENRWGTLNGRVLLLSDKVTSYIIHCSSISIPLSITSQRTNLN